MNNFDHFNFDDLENEKKKKKEKRKKTRHGEAADGANKLVPY